MSDLNELFAELKAEIADRTAVGGFTYDDAIDALYEIDDKINKGEFARSEQDAYIG